MGLRINTNILSLNAQRNLASTSKALGRSLERLSSGTRINRAGDDAAGLAISEGLRSQVRGLRQAVRNANDSLGFLNTAEGALAEITNITQRLRELAIQAANGAIGNRERGFLNDESEALLEEFNRIATQTEFNGTKLLDGSFVETDLQVGVNKGETISFTVGDARTSSLGALAIASGAQNQLRAFTSLTLGASQTGISVPPDLDKVSFQGNGYSALAVAGAINQASGTTGVRADALETVLQVNNINTGVAANSISAGEFTINNVSIVGSSASMDDFLATINSFASSTGVRARLVAGSSVDIQLYASDGRNINIGVAAGTASVNQVWNLFAGSDNDQGGVNANRLFTAAGLASVGLVAADSTYTGAIQLSSAKTIIIGGTGASNAVGFSDSVVTVDNTNAIFSISISEQKAAQDALATVDATLSQLNELRSKLGAVQNRLESTIRNLSIGLENISAAESQIKDADIAAETAELTRAQILQQAGIAVLGQANTASQVALQLLQF
jgi:flagellin